MGPLLRTGMSTIIDQFPGNPFLARTKCRIPSRTTHALAPRLPGPATYPCVPPGGKGRKREGFLGLGVPYRFPINGTMSFGLAPGAIVTVSTLFTPRGSFTKRSRGAPPGRSQEDIGGYPRRRCPPCHFAHG